MYINSLRLPYFLRPISRSNKRLQFEKFRMPPLRRTFSRIKLKMQSCPVLHRHHCKIAKILHRSSSLAPNFKRKPNDHRDCRSSTMKSSSPYPVSRLYLVTFGLEKWLGEESVQFRGSVALSKAREERAQTGRTLSRTEEAKLDGDGTRREMSWYFVPTSDPRGGILDDKPAKKGVVGRMSRELQRPPGSEIELHLNLRQTLLVLAAISHTSVESPPTTLNLVPLWRCRWEGWEKVRWQATNCFCSPPQERCLLILWNQKKVNQKGKSGIQRIRFKRGREKDGGNESWENPSV